MKGEGKEGIWKERRKEGHTHLATFVAYTWKGWCVPGGEAGGKWGDRLPRTLGALSPFGADDWLPAALP